VLKSPKDDQKRKGFVGYLQADVELVQGVHFMTTGELQNVGVKGTPLSWELWLSQVWFAAPHVDFRLDDIYQSNADVNGRSSSLELLAQMHLYL
jgi:hypothetical protein